MLHMVSNGFEYVALRGEGPPPLYNQPALPLSKWWENPVLRDPKRRTYSRKSLIHHFRNTLGGGHVASGFHPREDKPAEEFADLSRTNSGGWTYSDGKNTFVPTYGAEYATVRQIGWEMERTLERSCQDIIEGAHLIPVAGLRMKPTT
jgi:hypothetical protein